LKNVNAYATRGFNWFCNWFSKGRYDYDTDLRYYDRAIQREPEHALFWNNRGFTWHMKGLRAWNRPACEDHALSDYAEAIRLNPISASAINNRAWLLATTKVDRCRNGLKAVKEATKACELSDWKNAGYKDTLSCAYAEIGDFEQAIRWQKEALDDPFYRRQEGRIPRMKLRHFAKKQPFRE